MSIFHPRMTHENERRESFPNSLGQVVSAQHVNTGASSRHYTFDNIGNRTQHREGGHTSSTGTPTNYTPTALNQYSAVASLSPTYDSDGNMTSGPIPNAPTVLATFTWDGENRQLSVTPNGGSTTTALRDAMGRRVAKTTGSTRTYLLYDGWNIVAEYTGTVHTTGTPPALTLERTNVWGTDLSGSQQGAGGVGGLLAAYLHNAGGDSGVYYPTYDGNGNVSEYLNNSGAVQSHYEYDPFGNDITPAGTAGSLHNSFPFRFSTKYLDAESGQYHYIGRDYNQLLGRWNNHDPIEEQGGLNLYGFVRNTPQNLTDRLGLTWEISRNGGSQAIAGGECGDTIRSLAKKIHLDAQDYRKWLKPSGTDPLPYTVDEKLAKPSNFKIPNEVIITFGSTEPERYVNGEVIEHITPGSIEDMENLANFYRNNDLERDRKGNKKATHYKVIMLSSNGTKGTDFNIIKKVIQRENLAIWAHSGHGNYSESDSSLNGMLLYSNGNEFRAQAHNFSPIHHRLSEIYLSSCYQGYLKDDWITLVAKGGKLHAFAAKVAVSENPLFRRAWWALSSWTQENEGFAH